MTFKLDEEKIEHIMAIDIPGALSNKTNFTAELIRLIRKADPANKYRLGTVYPEEVEAVDRWEAACSRYIDTKMPIVGTVVIVGKNYTLDELQKKEDRPSFSQDSMVTIAEGMRGVVYEQYDRSSYDDEGGTGISILFENGFYCGFSKSELDLFKIQVTDEVIENLRNYIFTNVLRLIRDYHDGAFDLAFNPEIAGER